MGHEAGLRVVKEEDAKELLEIYRPYVENRWREPAKIIPLENARSSNARESRTQKKKEKEKEIQPPKDSRDKAMQQNFVPVLDDNKSFIGIVTRKDIMRYFSEHYRKVEEAV